MRNNRFARTSGKGTTPPRVQIPRDATTGGFLGRTLVLSGHAETHPFQEGVQELDTILARRRSELLIRVQTSLPGRVHWPTGVARDLPDHLTKFVSLAGRSSKTKNTSLVLFKTVNLTRAAVYEKYGRPHRRVYGLRNERFNIRDNFVAA